MNIYLESVDLDEIRNAAAAGLAGGVAFSHTASDAADANTKERLEEISREFAFPICVPVGAVASGDIYAEARELAKVSDHVVVQIPLVEDSLVPMARLTAEGVVVCATFVFSAAQAIIAAKTGAATVRVTLDDLESYGQSGTRTLAEIKSALEAGDEECDVMAASPRSAVLFAECALAGADIICVTPQTIPTN
jgi:transaldolase